MLSKRQVEFCNKAIAAIEVKSSYTNCEVRKRHPKVHSEGVLPSKARLSPNARAGLRGPLPLFSCWCSSLVDCSRMKFGELFRVSRALRFRTYEIPGEGVRKRKK